jgi:hypothetical protein
MDPPYLPSPTQELVPRGICHSPHDHRPPYSKCFHPSRFLNHQFNLDPKQWDYHQSPKAPTLSRNPMVI